MKTLSAAALLVISFGIISFLPFFLPHQASGHELKRLKGQMVYVPVYSNIMIRKGTKLRKKEGGVQFNLSVNISIRNTDSEHPITITKADYYDTEGKLTRQRIKEPLVIRPMASTSFFIEQSDNTGGPGANYIVIWQAETLVSEPVIESVTFGASGNHSVSFVSQGRALPVR